jgi:hypothetical protein
MDTDDGYALTREDSSIPPRDDFRFHRQGLTFRPHRNFGDLPGGGCKIDAQMAPVD